MDKRAPMTRAEAIAIQLQDLQREKREASHLAYLKRIEGRGVDNGNGN